MGGDGRQREATGGATGRSSSISGICSEICSKRKKRRRFYDHLCETHANPNDARNRIPTIRSFRGVARGGLILYQKVPDMGARTLTSWKLHGGSLAAPVEAQGPLGA